MHLQLAPIPLRRSRERTPIARADAPPERRLRLPTNRRPRRQAARRENASIQVRRPQGRKLTGVRLRRTRRLPGGNRRVRREHAGASDVVIPQSLAAARVVVCVGWYFLVGVIPTVGSVSEQTLLYSVADHVGVSGGTGSRAACHPIASGVQRCYITFPGDSTYATYRVTMHGSRCWHATRADVGGTWPRSASECAHLADQIHFWNWF